MEGVGRRISQERGVEWGEKRMGGGKEMERRRVGRREGKGREDKG